MREKLINRVKNSPRVLSMIYLSMRTLLSIVGCFVPIRKRILFSSFGGRGFNDSPAALYHGICSDRRFEDYDLVWAFVEPEQYELPRGRAIRIDTFSFFKELLMSEIWISNAGIDRGIELSRRRHVSVETWHGTPIKKIGDDSNNASALNENKLRRTDTRTIRCAQSEYDLEIFRRIFNADRESFLLCDLPRNDRLCCEFSEEERQRIRSSLGIEGDRKVLLYLPTYREYWMDDEGLTEMRGVIDVATWEKELGDDYCLLIRAHYAVNKRIDFADSAFARDVSGYPDLNELFLVSDILISDYSSAIVDYSILGRPILCYAEDYDEYMMNRGTYLDLEEDLPCPVDRDENTLIARIKSLDYELYSRRSREFGERFAPFAGHATEAVLEKITEKRRLIRGR